MLLVIDDDERFRSALVANLREDGFDIVEYASGSAVPLDRLSGVQLVLTDYLMGKEDGLAFAKRFHAAFPNVPIIIMTAYATAHLENEVAVQDHLTLFSKRLDYGSLLDRIQEKMRGSAAGGRL
jgi:DNA-binding NtrC family response regulator